MAVVIKYGGSAMTDAGLRRKVAGEIARLAKEGARPVVVHGGGPFIQTALDRAGLSSHFVRGLRVTSPESLVVIEEVLTRLSKMLAQDIGEAVGLSGRDSRLLTAEALPELGRVGKMLGVNAPLLRQFLDLGLTPVMACIAGTREGDDVLNVNADSVAGAVAGALSAPVLFLSDVPGVLANPQDKASLLRELREEDIGARIRDGRISDGMIPKVEAALEALRHGAAFAVIADGRDLATLKQAARGDAGTRIVRKAP